jgi:hypothetical protein
VALATAKGRSEVPTPGSREIFQRYCEFADLGRFIESLRYKSKSLVQSLFLVVLNCT